MAEAEHQSKPYMMLRRRDRKTVEPVLETFDKHARRLALTLSTSALPIAARYYEGFKVETEDT